jgi:hypothetical protein
VIHDTLQMTLLTVLRSLKTPSCLITAQAGRLIPHMQCGSHSCVPRSCRTASTIESATPRSKFTGHRLNCSIINDGVAFGTLQRLNYPPTSFPNCWRRVYPSLEELSTRHPGTAAQKSQPSAQSEKLVVTAWRIPRLNCGRTSFHAVAHFCLQEPGSQAVIFSCSNLLWAL